MTAFVWMATYSIVMDTRVKVICHSHKNLRPLQLIVADPFAKQILMNVNLQLGLMTVIKTATIPLVPTLVAVLVASLLI